MVGRTLSPGISPQPVTGSQLSCMPKIKVKEGPRTMDGMQIHAMARS